MAALAAAALAATQLQAFAAAFDVVVRPTTAAAQVRSWAAPPTS